MSTIQIEEIKIILLACIEQNEIDEEKDSIEDMQKKNEQLNFKLSVFVKTIEDQLLIMGHSDTGSFFDFIDYQDQIKQ